MKKFYPTFIFVFCVKMLWGQTPIPFGTSLDSVALENFYSNTNIQSFHCYKPSTYDSVNSPILFAIHGSGGNGTSAINDLDSIAERRKALIIAPNYAFSGFAGVMRHQTPELFYSDTLSMCVYLGPAMPVFTAIYKHVLQRENRNSVPAYMIGFSAGGQFVTRYMLMRQAYPDSIPIKMAISSNAYFYTFPTDTFNGVPMIWSCGLILPTNPGLYCPEVYNFYDFDCSEDVIQYYNENYGVLIGTGDTQPLGSGCLLVQGANRYERALNFYNFCDSNAVNRGTTLQWPYVEIPGIGHDQYGMYNTKANIADSSTIAETLLFDTPYHTVPSLAPVTSFYADTTLINVNGTVNFFNTSINATSYLWDFGDGTTSTAINPSHIYTVTDTFIVQLTATNNAGCDNWTERRHYIKVVDPNAISEINQNGFQIKIYPTPLTTQTTITFTNPHKEKFLFTLYDITGRVAETISTATEQIILNKGNKQAGLYLFSLRNEKTGEVMNGKIVIQ